MYERSASQELTYWSFPFMCEQIINHYGTDRGNGERVRRDFDWEAPDIDGSGLRLRLIQLRSLGAGAVYILRTRTEYGHFDNLYKYDTSTGEVVLATESRLEPLTDPIELEPDAMIDLVRTVSMP